MCYIFEKPWDPCLFRLNTRWHSTTSECAMLLAYALNSARVQKDQHSANNRGHCMALRHEGRGHKSQAPIHQLNFLIKNWFQSFSSRNYIWQWRLPAIKGAMHAAHLRRGHRQYWTHIDHQPTLDKFWVCISQRLGWKNNSSDIRILIRQIVFCIIMQHV